MIDKMTKTIKKEKNINIESSLKVDNEMEQIEGKEEEKEQEQIDLTEEEEKILNIFLEGIDEE